MRWAVVLRWLGYPFLAASALPKSEQLLPLAGSPRPLKAIDRLSGSFHENDPRGTAPLATQIQERLSALGQYLVETRRLPPRSADLGHTGRARRDPRTRYYPLDWRGRSAAFRRLRTTHDDATTRLLVTVGVVPSRPETWIRLHRDRPLTW